MLNNKESEHLELRKYANYKNRELNKSLTLEIQLLNIYDCETIKT